MNVYDTKTITCSKGRKSLVEVDSDELVICPACRHYSSLLQVRGTPQNQPKGRTLFLIPQVA